MIERLTGTLIEKNPPGLVVDVHGVGYELEAPMSTFYNLPAVDSAVSLFTHFLVREDAQLLYGFASRTERVLFRALLKVNGVGAKVALAVLSGMSTDDFLHCVANKDVNALIRIPGIGKKTAERLLIELQDKVETIDIGGLSIGTRPKTNDASARTQAEEALTALGYKSTEVKRLLDAHAGEADTVEQMIRAALRGAAR